MARDKASAAKSKKPVAQDKASAAFIPKIACTQALRETLEAMARRDERTLTNYCRRVLTRHADAVEALGGSGAKA